MSEDPERFVARLAALHFGELFVGDVAVSHPRWMWRWIVEPGGVTTPHPRIRGGVWQELGQTLSEVMSGTWLAISPEEGSVAAGACVIALSSGDALVIEGRAKDDPRWQRASRHGSGYLVYRFPPESREAALGDILSEAHRLSERLVDAETFRTVDPDTGLLNRAAFLSLVEQTIARSRRDGRPFTVARLDVEGLSAYGGQVSEDGQQALRQLATLLVETVRREDCVARLGEQEFACLFLGGDGQESPAALDRIRRKLRMSSLTEKYNIKVYMGAYTCFEPVVSAIEVLNNADVMLALEKDKTHAKK